MAGNWFTDAFANPGFRTALSEMGQDLGYGLANSTNIGNAFGEATRRSAQMQPYRDLAQQQKAEEEKRAAQINATAAFLRSKGAEDLAAAVEGGTTTGADAFNQWYQQANAQPELTADMRNFQFAQDNPGFAEFMGGGQKPTASMQEYQFAVSQGYDGTFQQYETDMKRAGATSIDFNANQGTAAAYADRMAAANAILDDPKLTAAQTDVGQAALSGVPLAGNLLTSEHRKMAEQAQRDFINAILRRESGAVISPTEFENAAKQYFPQPGDTPAVIEQKRQNRINALNGVVRAAGPNYQQPPAMGAGGAIPAADYFR